MSKRQHYFTVGFIYISALIVLCALTVGHVFGHMNHTNNESMHKAVWKN